MIFFSFRLRARSLSACGSVLYAWESSDLETVRLCCKAVMSVLMLIGMWQLDVVA